MIMSIVPLVVVCGECGRKLYEGEDIISVDTLIRKLKGRCPNCGKELRLRAENIKVEGLPRRRTHKHGSHSTPKTKNSAI